MFEQFSIRVKLIAIFVMTGIFCLISINLVNLYIARRSFLNAAFDSFTAIREIKKQQIEFYFEQIRNQCHTFAHDTMIINAMKEFKQTFYQVDQNGKYTPEQIATFTDGLKQYYKKDYLARLNPNVDVKHTVEEYFKNMQLPTTILQHFYIAANPNPTGQKDNLNMANDGSTYSKWHGKYHPIIREFLKKFGYYDIFLIDIESGAIMYTVFKEVDYATSLLTGPFKNSNFAQVFLAAQEAMHKDDVKIIDFAYYDPSYGAPAAFIAAPIFDQDKKIGVLAFQFPIDKINEIMTNDKKWKETGLGNSGEMYLIGQDYKMRTVSRFLEEDPKAFFTTLEQVGVSKQVIDKIRLLKTTILIQEINTPTAHEVMRGNTGTMLSTNYRNIPVVSSFTPLAITGLKWGLIAEIDEKEVLSPIKHLVWAAVGWGFLLLLVLILFSLFTVHMILRPIKKVIAGMRTIANAKYVTKRDELVIESNDEVGQLAQLINSFITTVHERMMAIKTVKNELQAIATQITHTTEQLQMHATTTQTVTNQAMHAITELYQTFGIAADAVPQYQQSLHDLIKGIGQIEIALESHDQSHASIRNNIQELQKTDQKLLAALEKEIFDLRQTAQYLDDGIIASAQKVIKTMVPNTEHSVSATRMSLSTLDQIMVVFAAEQTGHQKLVATIHTLKKYIETMIKQLADNKMRLTQGQITMDESKQLIGKIQRASQEAVTISAAIVDALQKLDTYIEEFGTIR
jgi:methyl-accepting chemotaxis protein